MGQLTYRPNAFQRSLHPILRTQASGWFLARTLHHLDRPMLRFSRGRYSLTSLLAGLPVVMVSTVGAKSGLPRNLPLVAIADGENVILIASNFGQTHHPAWYHNLRAHPEVQLTYAGQTVAYTARETVGDERERCWRRAAALYSGYPLYQRRAARYIPVMLLAPYSSKAESNESGFIRWRAAEDGFARWQLSGVSRAADGTLQFQQATASAETDPYAPGAYHGRNFYNGGSFFVGEAISPIVSTPFAFAEAVAAWNASTPPGTWIEMQIRARLNTRWSKWYNLGVWASDHSTIERHSVKQQDDMDGYVAADTLVVTNKESTPNALQLKVRLFSAAGNLIPVVRNLSVAFSTPAPKKAPILLDGNREHWNQLLNVPACSQMVYADGGEAWCSPTSTSMVLKYWANDTGPCELVVRATVAGVNDWVYDGYGNWSFNIAYAAAQNLEGYVVRFTTLRQVEDWIAAGVPVIASLAWGKGELTGAPIPSNSGHLVTIVGFDAEGNPIVNDPAAAAASDVRRTYIRSEFEIAWLKSSGGIVYVMYPANAAVPSLP